MSDRMDAYSETVERIRREERERIIALLEAMNVQGTIQTYVRLNGTDKPSPSAVYIDRLRAIALIKGESE